MPGVHKTNTTDAKNRAADLQRLAAMIMEQELNNIERMYDTVAKEYSETFSGEHEKRPKDQEILHNQRFDPLFTLDPFMTPLPFTC